MNCDIDLCAGLLTELARPHGLRTRGLRSRRCRTVALDFSGSRRTPDRLASRGLADCRFSDAPSRTSERSSPRSREEVELRHLSRTKTVEYIIAPACPNEVLSRV
jgi:hypothetical protein